MTIVVCRQECAAPMFQFVFDVRLFRLSVNAPTMELLFELPPR